MIGDKESRNQIKELLHKIANKNKEKYGHILDDTDCGNTTIFLGYYKHNFDSKQKYHMYFDIISGHFIDAENDYSYNTLWGHYFELSDTFEDDMREKIKKLKICESSNKDEGKDTVDRLQKLVSE